MVFELERAQRMGTCSSASDGGCAKSYIRVDAPGVPRPVVVRSGESDRGPGIAC